MRRLVITLALLALLLPAGAHASDATLRAAVVNGNVTLAKSIAQMNAAGKAYGDKETAANRLRLTNSVVKVRQTTQTMLTAISKQQPSTNKGREAKPLLLSGYRLYILSINELLATIRAEARDDQVAAEQHYRKQAAYARQSYPKLRRAATLLGLS